MSSRSVGTQTKYRAFGRRLLKKLKRSMTFGRKNRGARSKPEVEILPHPLRLLPPPPLRPPLCCIVSASKATETDVFPECRRMQELNVGCEGKMIGSRHRSDVTKVSEDCFLRSDGDNATPTAPVAAFAKLATNYECVLDVSTVEPPPIVAMDLFREWRSRNGGRARTKRTQKRASGRSLGAHTTPARTVPLSATAENLESAMFLSATMDNK